MMARRRIETRRSQGPVKWEGHDRACSLVSDLPHNHRERSSAGCWTQTIPRSAVELNSEVGLSHPVCRGPPQFSQRPPHAAERHSGGLDHFVKRM